MNSGTTLLFRSGVNFGLQAGWRKCYFRSIVPSSCQGQRSKEETNEREKVERRLEKVLLIFRQLKIVLLCAGRRNVQFQVRFYKQEPPQLI